VKPHAAVRYFPMNTQSCCAFAVRLARLHSSDETFFSWLNATCQMWPPHVHWTKAGDQSHSCPEC